MDARPASRRTRSARGCRARGSARAPGARSIRSSPAGWSAGRDEYNDCRARLGLPPLDRLHTALSRELTLVATLPQLEYPRDWPAWTRITGPLLWEPPGERVDPPPGDGPVVLIAPSTAQDPGHRMLRAALAGLAGAPVRVIATYNGRVPDPPVRVPANAVLVPWLSYARTMPACDLVVTHGGHGTLVRALACGCPVVVCPAGGDMPENAARADWAGLGVRLPGRLLSPRTLRLAVERRAGPPRRSPPAPAPPPAWLDRHDGAVAAARALEALDRPIRGRSPRVSRRLHPVEEAHMHLRRALVALLLLPLLLVVACGDDSDSGGSTQTAGGDSGPAIEGAKVIDPASMDSAKGNVTFCTGKDTTGSKTAGVKAFNAANPDMNVKMTEFPESADEQRNQFVQRQEAKSSECDVFYSDVIWTAEFAVQKWLYDMTPYVESRKDEFIPSTFDTATYQDKVWGVPHKTNAGFLYYRTDQVDNPPTTWQDVYKQAAATNGIAYQGAAYEGLTVDFLELAFAAGGKVLSDDGSKAEIDSPENLKALQFMVDGIKDGAAPKSVTTYMEEPARRAFESGRVTFLRNWPYVYATANRAKATKGNFEVMPFPEFEGGGKAGILGGANLVISTYTKNPGGALKFIDYMTSKDRQSEDVVKFSDASPLKAVYEDPAVRQGPAVLAGAEVGGGAGDVAPGVAGLSADLRGDLQERQLGALGRHEPGGRAEERAGPDRPGARDVLAPRGRAAVPYAGTAVRPVARTHTTACSTSSSCSAS